MKLFEIQEKGFSMKFRFINEQKGGRIYYDGFAVTESESDLLVDELIYTFLFDRPVDSWENMSEVEVQNETTLYGLKSLNFPLDSKWIPMYVNAFVEGIKNYEAYSKKVLADSQEIEGGKQIASYKHKIGKPVFIKG